MSWTSPPGAWGAADPLFLLLIALGVEAYLGGRGRGFAWLGNPRRALAVLALDLARRLNRPDRPTAACQLRGALIAGGLALGALAFGWLAGLVTRHYPFAWTLELCVLIVLIDQRATWRLGEAVQQALASGSPLRAREALRPLAAEALAPPEIDRLDFDGIVTAALEALGRRFASRLLAPILWYVLLGLPGLFLQQCAYIVAVTLSSTGPFSDASRSLARALAWLPDRVAALILAGAAAFVPGGRFAAGVRGALKGGAPAQGVLAAALAGVKMTRRLNRALAVFTVACLIDAGLIGALAVVRLGF